MPLRPRAAIWGPARVGPDEDLKASRLVRFVSNPAPVGEKTGGTLIEACLEKGIWLPFATERQNVDVPPRIRRAGMAILKMSKSRRRLSGRKKSESRPAALSRSSGVRAARFHRR